MSFVNSSLRLRTALLFLLAVATYCGFVARAAAETGPTLHFDYGRGEPLENSVAKFMYFVPLISPEPVAVVTNANNTQRARILSRKTTVTANTFVTTCEFEFLGNGYERNIFDNSDLIRRNEKSLKAGKVIGRQISGINVEGGGSGLIEVNGTITNGNRKVQMVRMCFNYHGKTSPVLITLQDISYRNGRVRFDNDIVARVNTLTFRRIAGEPKMEVSLASVKSADAGTNAWQNLVGAVKGAAANLLLDPLDVDAGGHQAMLDFGLTLATAQPNFTFPFATRLKGSAGQ